MEFTNYISTYFAESEYPIDIEVELPVKLVPITKWQAGKHGELAHDEARHVTSAIKSFEIHMLNVIIDRATQHLSRRFTASPLMNDISWLDPRCFSNIRNLDKLPESAHHEVSTLAKVEPGQVGRELLQFAVHYDDYKKPLQEQESSICSSKGSDEDDWDESMEYGEECNATWKQSARNVLSAHWNCCTNWISLAQYTHRCISFTSSYRLSLAQVSCEIVFSVLKLTTKSLTITTRTRAPWGLCSVLCWARF